MKPDRTAINRLLDEFVPDVVEQKNLKFGWQLVAGYERTVSYHQWVSGDTSVETYPAKGSTFHGWLVNYSRPGDIGFDILLQSRNPKQGAWSFRGEAQKFRGRWRITSWYPVASYAPPGIGKTQTVLGPNDLGPADSSATAADSKGRLPSWVLALPVAGIGALILGAVGFLGVRSAKRHRRVREIEELLARDR